MPTYDDDPRYSERPRRQARSGRSTSSGQRARSDGEARRPSRSSSRTSDSSRRRSYDERDGRRRSSGSTRGDRDRRQESRRGSSQRTQRKRTSEQERTRDARANDRRASSTNRNRPRGDSRTQARSGSVRQRDRRSNAQESLPLQLYHRLEDVLPDFIPPIFALSLVALVIFLVFILLIVPTCGRSSAKSAASVNPSDAVPSEQAPSPSSNEEFDFDMNEPHQAALVKLLGEKEAAKLLNKARTNIDALWIAAHIDEYAFDGSETQYKLIKLAADEDDAIPFVRSYPSSYPTAGPDDKAQALSAASPSSDVPGSEIPHLYQWDMRWANTSFAENALGVSGSGPTCLAMVCQGLTGNDQKTPYDIGKAAEKAEEAVTEKLGMKASYLYDGAKELGLNCAEQYPSYESMRDALLTGNAIILDIEPGQFTSSDSFVVLTGIAGDGKAIMNDPNSMEHSARTWDLDELAAMATTMYVYSV